MTGVAGRSGRKGFKHELATGHLSTKIVAWANTNWDKPEEEGGFTKEDRMRLASLILPKMVVEKKEVEHTIALEDRRAIHQGALDILRSKAGAIRDEKGFREVPIEEVPIGLLPIPEAEVVDVSGSEDK